MRRSFLLATTLVVLAASPRARADDATCGGAFDESQVRRDEGKLLEARRLLRVCGGPSCSPTQQKLCSEWLADVDARMPSFILAAKDGSGTDLVDVKVLIDGQQVAAKLDGRAVDVDPGPHKFVFELADGARAETTAVADERGKSKVVSVTLERPAAPILAPPSAAVAATAPTPRGTTSVGGGGAVRTAGLVAGGAGVAGLALGTVLGVMALATKGTHCGSNGLCDPGSASTVYSQATISTVGFVAGGALLASGVTLFLVAPKGRGEQQSRASLAVGPTVGLSAGGVQLAGRW